MRRWLRLDAQWDDTEWVMLLGPLSQLAWIKLLCYVKRDGRRGTALALTPKAAAKKWGVSVEAVEDMIFQAQQDGALKVMERLWVVAKWSDYQEPDLTAAERKRRQRAGDGPESPNVTPESRRDTVAHDHRPPTTDGSNSTDAIASEGEPSVEEITVEELHELVRRALHHGRDDSEARTSHSRLRRDLWGKLDPAEIRDGIMGICRLRGEGKLSAWEPHFGLRQALRWHHEGRQLWDAAVDYERGYSARPSHDSLRIKTSAMQRAAIPVAKVVSGAA